MRLAKPFLLAVMLLLTLPCAAPAGAPSSEPVLRIDTAMHTAPITSIAVDAGERFIVTGSLDKTVKLWELGTGRLIKTFRPPLGQGAEGKICAVAVSPDGRHIAAGGWTGYEWDESFSIYIFGRETGGLMARLTGLPDVINHLAYSRDGRYLAACLANNGIRVYRVGVSGGYHPVFEDKDYGGQSHGAAFDASGRLVTTSYDGHIRLYDRDFRLRHKRRTAGGGRPYGVAFSPDGRRIAVGFADTKNVDLYAGEDLSFIQALETGDIDNGYLSTVSFSPDGRSLLAGGGADKSINNERMTFIRRWETAGPGASTDIPAAKNTITGIIPLKRGGVVFASGEPSFGLTDRAGRPYYIKRPDKADFRDNLKGFSLSYDGAAVGFGYEQFGKSPARFDMGSLSLTPSPPGAGLTPPLTEGKRLKVTDWRNNFHPKLNGKDIELKQYERSRSLALLPGEGGFVLGTEWYLRLYDGNGGLKWRVDVPSAVWGVNVSGDGRLVAAAIGDGTIRWYRVEDGKELLAFFPHGDRKRWVLWTPRGYYASSPGAEELVGWHMNNGADKEADFFPASRFRGRFFRPDVIARVLTTRDEEEAVALADAESGRKRVEASVKDILPPVVTILSPPDGARITTRELTVRYSLRNPSGEPVTNIKVLLDGRPVSGRRGVKITGRDGGEGELQVTMPARDTELSLIAENRFAAGVPATVRLHWGGAREDGFVVKPKLYILAVGVSRYKDEALRLSFAHKDAADFADAMLTQRGKLYGDVKVKLLKDEGATKEEILDGLEWLQRETTSKDIAMLFLAGHGVNDSAGIYYFLPQNADLDRLKRTAVPFSDIKNTVSSLAGKVAMFVDTCHAGGVMGKRAVTDITGVINELTGAENGVVVFASSTGRQYSLEDPRWGNGAFTRAVIEGLKGRADLLGKGKITVNMLDAFVAERVKELTGGRQTPVTTKPNTVPDFPIAVR